MENVIDREVIATSSQLAPYAEVIIPLYLGSVTGFKYRTLNCMECGHEFLERNNDTLYRINDQTMPAEHKLDGHAMPARCGHCHQNYAVQISLNVTLEQNGVPMYLQPQSVYITVDNVKKLRYLHCLECGKAFHSISDRIRQVVDNRVPFEQVDPAKLGPFQTLCHRPACGQTWALMI